MIALDRDMPKNCMVCPACDDNSGVCMEAKKFVDINYPDERPEWCPWIKMHGVTLADEQIGKYLYVKE